MERMHDQQKEILLVPLGKVLMDVLEEIAVAVRKTYKFHVRIGRTEEPDNSAYSDERRQYDAEKLLALVANRKRENQWAVLGVVDTDMFVGEKAFVFGAAVPGRGAGVVALTRLREEFYKKPSNRERFLRRVVTEAIDQVGLAAGLPACVRKKCVLVQTTTLWKLDEKDQFLCDECQGRIKDLLYPPRLSVQPEAGKI